MAVIKTLKNKKTDENIIDLIVPTESEEEIKQILKEASSLDEDEEFKDWTQIIEKRGIEDG